MRRSEDAAPVNFHAQRTKALDREGWRDALKHAEARCQRLGVSAAVIELAICASTGRRIEQPVGELLSTLLQPGEVVAQLHEGAFVVLLADCSDGSVDLFVEEVERRLASLGVEVAIGTATRHGAGGLLGAWREADARLYAARRTMRHQAGAQARAGRAPRFR